MAEQRTEYMHFSRKAVEELAQYAAKICLVGSAYWGNIGEQEVRWTADGGIEVFTKHTPHEGPLAPVKPDRRHRRKVGPVPASPPVNPPPENPG